MEAIDALREQLDYCQETGVFTWKESRGARKAGDIAGGVNVHGYARIKVGKKGYLSHRLAWAFVSGSFPDGDIDHCNGDRADNRIMNLRLVSKSENQWNRSSKTGHKGVTWNKEVGKWSARCQANGRRFHIGYFEDKSAALAAYRDKAKQLHGNFYREG